MSQEAVSVSNQEVGLETVGALRLSLSWRASKRVSKEHYREWYNSSLALPLEELIVVPRDVLFWDSEPERPNSLRRFAHMLGLRAVPTLLLGGNEPDNMQGMVVDKDQKHLLGYQESRDQTVDLTTNYLEAEYPPGHLRRENTRLVFRYEPPETKDGQAALQEFLQSAA